MKAIEKISQELFDNLKAPYIKNLSMGDEDSNSTDDAEQARNFAFNFSVGNFTLGTVQVKLNSDKQYLEVQFGHDLLNKVEDQSPEVQQRIKQLWFGFLRKMRKFVNTCPELTFKINNETQDHLNKKDAEMYTVDELKEGKMSKLAGSTKSSYQRVGENRIIIRHVGPIDEEKMGSRTRNIKAIYIENAAGERFLVKENSLIGARILAHHMSAGGNLMDDFSNHLYTMIREMRDLKSFVLASRNKVFESDDANQMVEAATEYYRALRETVRSLTTGRGYARYLESFDPKIDETNIDAEALKEKFVIRTFNEKFEAALPHIAKAYQKKIQEQNALYGAAQNYIDGETKFGLTESDVELYKSMKFESGQALSKKVLEHIATLLQGTDSRLSEFAAQSAEKFSTITEAPESQTWLHQDLAMNLVKGFVAEMNNLSEKALNPYAIGMAQAMKSTGDEPPLKKSTIKKAHHIADKIADKEQGMAEGLGKSIKRGLQGWGSPQDTPANIVKRNKAYDIDTAKGLRAGMDDAAADHSPQGLQKRVLDRKLKGVAEMDKSQTPPGRDGGEQFPPGPKVSKKDIKAVQKDPAKHLSDLFAKQYAKKKIKEQGVAEGSDAAKYYIVNHDTNENIDGPFDTREEAETVYDRMIKRVESGTMEKNFKIQKKKGVAEGSHKRYQPKHVAWVVSHGDGHVSEFKPHEDDAARAQFEKVKSNRWASIYAIDQHGQSIPMGSLKAMRKKQGVTEEVMVEISSNTLKSYQQKVSNDAMKHKMDPTKRSPEKANRSISGFSKAQKRLEKGVAEGSETECPRCHSTDIKTYSDGEKKCHQCHKTWDEQGVAEGSSDNNAVIYDNGYVKIDGKMYKAKRMNHESGLGIVIQTPTKMYFSPIENEYEMPSVTIHRALKMGGLNPVFNEGVAEGSSDISGLMAASHLNKSFIITAETAEGQTKRFRVNAQSERVAKEKFEKHHSMAKIVSIKEEGMAENIEGHQDELEKNLRYSGSRSSVADVIRQKLNPNSAPELYGLKVGDVVKARVDDQIVQGNVIDLFPETMEVELLLRGDMAGRTVTVDVRDTEYMDESGVAEERKVTKNEKGEVTSWSDETPWHKAKPKKQPSGTAANLAGQALQQTKKMAHKEEPNMTESKATTDNKVFTDTLAMLKKYSGI